MSFLTIIPTGIYDIEYAAKYFYLIPLVAGFEGIIIGLITLFKINIFLSACIATIVLYILTGFNHLDGFADFTDVIVSGKRGADAYNILKEVHRGSAAIASTVLSILSTYVSIIFLGKYSFIHIITIILLSGESMYMLTLLSKEPPYNGLGRIFIKGSRDAGKIMLNILLTTIIIILLIIYLNYPLQYIIITIMTISLGTLFAYSEANRILGFVNGDVLGFCFEINKTASLLMIAILVSTALSI